MLFLNNKPRKVTGALSEFVHIYVDASFEPEVYSGIGGVIYDAAGSLLGFFSEKVPDETLKQLTNLGQKTVIQELEALSLLAAFTVFESFITGKRVVVFTDSDSVRGAFLKSWSNSDQCDRIVLALLEVEESLNFHIWVERVPSQSNPSDFFSRESVEVHNDMPKLKCEVHKLWTELVHPVG